MRKALHIFMILLVAIGASCSKGHGHDCFKRNGKTTSQVRSLPAFDSVLVNDNVEVFVINGSEYKVEILAGENVAGNITAEVKNRGLEISNTNKCNFVRGYHHQFKAIITTPRLFRITHNGYADLHLDHNLGFTQDSISLRAGGAGDMRISGYFKYINSSTQADGDIYFAGTAAEAIIYVAGTSFIYADELKVSQHLYVASYTSGNCSFGLNNAALFDGYIRKSGNIYYSGNAATVKVINDDNSPGQLIKK